MEKKVVVFDTNLVSSSFSIERYSGTEFNAAKLMADKTKFEILITPFTFYELIGDFHGDINELCIHLSHENISVLNYRGLSIDLGNPSSFSGKEQTIVKFIFDDIYDLFGVIAFSFLLQLPGYSSMYEDTPLLNEAIREMSNRIIQASCKGDDPKQVIKKDVYSILINSLSSYLSVAMKRSFSVKEVSKLIFQKQMKVVYSRVFSGENFYEQMFVCNALLDRIRRQNKANNKPFFLMNDLIDCLNAHAAFQQKGFYFLSFDRNLCDYMLLHKRFLKVGEKDFILDFYTPSTLK
jgi:hypothetical protein